MGLKVALVRRDQDGITVPYPPIRDEIRNNRGFTDVRGNPEAAAAIAEGVQSAELRRLLVALSQPGSRLFTLACDIGAHRKKEWFAIRREATGGYVQVLSTEYADQTDERYRAFATQIENAMRAVVGRDSWTLRIELTPVQFNLDDYGQFVWSLSIWFFAEHKTADGAVESRERLIKALHSAISDPAAVAIFEAAGGA